MPARFTCYSEFWPHYLRQHSRAATRAAHYIGTALALACLAAGAILADWRWLPAAPILGYAIAWLAHGLLEGNRPATFGHPLWSLYSDFRMLGLAVTGRLERHLRDYSRENDPGR